MNGIEEVKRLRFPRNNGMVLRQINILRYKYVDIVTAEQLATSSGIKPNEFMDAINYLSEEGYIHLRNIRCHADANIADSDCNDLETKVTAKGIKLLGGGITDSMVEV